MAALQVACSADQQTFILSIPGPLYGDEATEYIERALSIYPEIKVTAVWTTSASESLVKFHLVTVDPIRAKLIGVIERRYRACDELPLALTSEHRN